MRDREILRGQGEVPRKPRKFARSGRTATDRAGVLGAEFTLGILRAFALVLQSPATDEAIGVRRECGAVHVLRPDVHRRRQHPTSNSHRPRCQ